VLSAPKSFSVGRSGALWQPGGLEESWLSLRGCVGPSKARHRAPLAGVMGAHPIGLGWVQRASSAPRRRGGRLLTAFSVRPYSTAM
jgi:hypothetical protein